MIISYLSVFILRLATGSTLLLKKKATKVSRILTKKRGRRKRSREIPADFMATSSKVSPRLPRVMIEERSTASGRARGTTVAATYTSRRRTEGVQPFTDDVINV